jgi:hypothetical protein
MEVLIRNASVGIAMLLFYVWWVPAAAAAVGLWTLVRRPGARLLSAGVLVLAAAPVAISEFAKATFAPLDWRAALSSTMGWDLLITVVVLGAAPVAAVVAVSRRPVVGVQ